jgi:predicted RNA binding protein with dsRBD fold (UPF0201 family)
MKVKISTPVFPTEDESRIMKALEKYFPEIKFKATKKEIFGETDKLSSLNLLRDKIMERQIKNTVRYLMLQYKTDTGSKLMLNKQAFIIGKINFVEENYSLGNVIIDIETDNLEHTLDYITGIAREA